MQNTQSAENQRLENMCFEDFKKTSDFGFGSKRIYVDIEGTITEKYPFRAFGYKDEQQKLYVGIRRYYDQGDSFKLIDFDPQKTITSHLVELIKEFQEEEENLTKNSLNKEKDT